MAETLRDLINEALEPGVFGQKPDALPDPWIEGSSDGRFLRDLCLRCGFGAVLHHVEAIWRQWAIESGLEGAEHTTAACRSVRESWIRRAKKAMQEASDG